MKHLKLFYLLFFFAFLSCNANNPPQKIYKPFRSIVKIKNYRLARALDTSKNRYVINETFLGNQQRNYYGNEAPDKLNVIWKTNIGTGKTRVGKDIKVWSGAGWTGQPLLIKDSDQIYIIQGAYDHNLKKIRLIDGKIVAQYPFDDVIKGTGTIWTKFDNNGKIEDFYILQGSRMGFDKYLNSDIVPSYREISFSTMKDQWQYNSIHTRSYSRDVDGSALIINDTAYLGLENAFFISFDPNPISATLRNGLKQPKIYDTDSLYFASDIAKHGGNLVTESSCSYLNGKIFITSGSGHVYAYNLKTKTIDWRFDTGSDMDGSPIVTDDSCIIISIERQYIVGNGGVMKLNPSLPADKAVVWYFPTGNRTFAMWEGGVIGSVGISDFYSDTVHLAAFVAIDGNLYVVKHDEIDKSKMAKSPDNTKSYPMPKLVFKFETGPSISTPLIVGNKLIAATYQGVYLFEFDKKMNFKLLAHQTIGSYESTPFVWNRKVYVASRDGNLYCFGD